VNADAFPSFAREIGPDFFTATYTIGLWAWEVEEFPPTMHEAFDHVDEIWAISDFTREAIAPHTDKPVLTFPMPVEPIDPPKVGREELGLPPGFLFLFTFDYLSIVERKNPFGVIEAFARAFPEEGQGPVLVIKGINGELRAADRERVRYIAGSRSDIVVLEEYFDAEATLALLQACDAFVSLHRCEGYGLAIAEAMALGKPVVCTNYSGNVDFSAPEVVYLVPYELVQIPAGCEPYPTTSRWADPDLDVAVQHLRDIYADQESARARGVRAQEYILATWTLERSARFMKDRLDRALRPRGDDAMPPHLAQPADRSLPSLVRQLSYELSTDSALPPPSSRVRRVAMRAAARMLGRHEVRQQRQLQAIHAVAEAAVERYEDQDRQLTAVVSELETVKRSSATAYNRISRDLAGLNAAAGAAVTRLDALTARVDDVAGSRLSTLIGRVDQGLARVDAADARLDEAVTRLDALVHEVHVHDVELAAEPFRTNDLLLDGKDHLGRATLGYRAMSDEAASYADFEDLFRGSTDFVKERLTPYVVLVANHQPVIDLGCGRGEFLAALNDAAVRGAGVDIDASMVERASRLGLDVRLESAATALEQADEGSVGAITSFQVVEHLEPSELAELFRLAYRALETNGVLIVETVNPHSPAALKAFWLDLTHVRPLYPESLLFLAREAGFAEANILFVHGGSDLRTNLRSCGEYALVAQKRS
jgi:glycosyltransferase involved in cell wall biosynthesis/SAM-dependent methyltransferase